MSLLNVLGELKKCCNHPFLFESAEENYRGDEHDKWVVAYMFISLLSLHRLAVIVGTNACWLRVQQAVLAAGCAVFTRKASRHSSNRCPSLPAGRPLTA